MIIECKNCNTKYRVDESKIVNNGRMVCCSQCEYEWLYIPDPSNITQKNNYTLPSLKISKSRIAKWVYIYYIYISYLHFIILFFLF